MCALVSVCKYELAYACNRVCNFNFVWKSQCFFLIGTIKINKQFWIEKLPCVLFLLDPLFPFNIFEYYTSNKQIDRLSVNQKGGSQGILSTKEFIIPYFLSQTCIKTIKIWPPQQWNVLFKWWRGCNIQKSWRRSICSRMWLRASYKSLLTR